MKFDYKLFLTGLLQVIFVCLNTFQIAVYAKTKHTPILFGIFAVGLIISLIWSFNVKKIAFGTFVDRLSYALGAGTGSIVGVLIGSYLY